MNDLPLGCRLVVFVIFLSFCNFLFFLAPAVLFYFLGMEGFNEAANKKANFYPYGVVIGGGTGHLQRHMEWHDKHAM
jgi:hypothetical protein